MNMRKIIAVLSAVLMLCAIIPMGVFAADGDVILSKDFNDGSNGFSKGSIVADGPDGSNCFMWSATGGWGYTEVMTSGAQANTDYTVSFKAKASVAGGMGTTIQNGDWGAYMNGPSFQVTTSWKEYTLTFNSGSYPNANGKMLFKWQDVGVAMDLYIDDLVIYEGAPKLPIITNGDFETGDTTSWKTHQTITVTADAAHDGSYGARLQDNGTWGGIMDQTLNVEAGKTYEISFWIKVNLFGINVQIKDGSANGTQLAGGWFPIASYGNWTEVNYTVTPTTNALFLNFCGGGGADPDASKVTDTYIDSFVVTEVKDPSFDGYLTNGDFETGKLGFATNQGSATGAWYNLWGSTAHELVEGYNSDYALKGTAGSAYNITYQVVNVEPNTNYTVWAYSKNSSNSALWIKNAGGNGDITNKSLNSGSDWALTSVSFNSGSNSTVWIGLMGIAAGGTYTVDDVFMFETQPESNDGYIVNGTFETGAVSPWNNLWGSCPTVEIVKGGKDSTFALHIVSGEWKHVRQMPISVVPNTQYKISVWAKDSSNMSLLVKGLQDDKTTETGNIVNKGTNAGADWTEFTAEFNSGDHNYILVSFMGGTAEAYGTFDSVVMECLHTCNVVEQERVEADCENAGYIKYACDCGLGEYTETIPALGHAWVDADCDDAKTCSVCGATEGEALGHTYDNNLDVDCNVCGDIREVEILVFDGKSTSVDVKGLAFKFSVDAAGAEIWDTTYSTYKSGSATIDIDGVEYALKYSGAIVSNVENVAADELTITNAQNNGNKTILNIGAKYLYECEADYISYVIRVINIPEANFDSAISARPYYIYENAAGDSITVYGDVQVGSYNG